MTGKCEGLVEVEGEAAEVPSGDVDIVVLLRIAWCGGGGAVQSGASRPCKIRS